MNSEKYTHVEKILVLPFLLSEKLPHPNYIKFPQGEFTPKTNRENVEFIACLWSLNSFC